MRFERGADPEMAETGFAPLRGADSANSPAAKSSPAWWTSIPGAREPLRHRAFAQGTAARDGRGRARRGDRSDSRRAGLCAAARRRERERDSPQAAWKCRQPSWRQDVTREVDLIEEVARHYGLDKFPAAAARRKTAGGAPASRRSRRSPARTADRPGLSGDHHDSAGERRAKTRSSAPTASTPARIANPLAEDASLLRSTGLVTMAHALAMESESRAAQRAPV